MTYFSDNTGKKEEVQHMRVLEKKKHRITTVTTSEIHKLKREKLNKDLPTDNFEQVASKNAKGKSDKKETIKRRPLQSLSLRPSPEPAC